MTKRQDVDYRLVQGSTNDWEVIFTGSESLDWTNFAARGVLRSDFRDYAPDTLATISVIITVATPGVEKRLFCRISDTDSDAVTAPEGRYDIEIFNGTVTRRVISEVEWENSLQVTDQ